MKKFLIILAAAAACSPTLAQRRGRKAENSLETVQAMSPQEAIDRYDFDEAENVLTTKIAELRRLKQATREEEELLEKVRKSKIRLNATEQVTFIDSLALPKDKLLAAMKFQSAENGRVLPCAEFFHKRDERGCTVFLNQLGDKIIYAQPDKGNHLRLFESALIDGEWTMTRRLEGLGEEEDDNLNFPFLLNDGVTMYFAAENGESLGGYDIYMTRYDADTQKYLAPENVGMPFNSPANDYLMMFDEFNNLGCLVSDRNQPADSVCMYFFIPNETRRVYDSDNMEPGELASRARINSIKDTWENREAVQDARRRLRELREGARQESEKRDFAFVVNDRKMCYTLGDFKSAEARSKAKVWQECVRDLADKRRMLDQLRAKYAAANEAEKTQMTAQIRLVEHEVEERAEEIRKQEKEIRRLELK